MADPGPEDDYPELQLPDWAQQDVPLDPGWSDADYQKRLQELRTVPPGNEKQLEEAAKRDAGFLERKERNKEFMADPVRLATDLARGGVTQEQFEDMRNGDPDHGGERLPLGFESHEQYQRFQGDVARVLSSITVNGQPITATVQIMGTSTSFYSGNPGKDEGHHWDREERGKSDYDIDVVSPELVKALLQNPEVAANTTIIREGQYVIFKSNDENGFYGTYPAFAELARDWKAETGRDFEFKLKMDMTPVADQPAPPQNGPIEVLRRG